ncbi:sigma-54 dependent transcriptional regulator [Geobacter pelophilus]|uniref:Sigma-54 dependent transcriptional regulator n=1 Tax=Geoanaerobacter pelophilus TaxID=60036 RepID=A0AAW4LDY6_9BACT|nr:sigma-54 dependent transcriptional regulator [Geoanaerobacter pelophilus]MBT0666112.1 sigma-54 dependent transcriptional regulator [Geoanaerobacter pelophilus]
MNEIPILLVDDELRLLKASQLLLASKGFKNVFTLSNSCDVMDYLQSNDVAIIVLDLNMPKLSGFDLLPEIVNEYPATPVIVMTAVDETDTAVNCMKKGAFDFLVKPVETERLVATIRKAIEHRAICRELDSLRERFFSETLDHAEAFSPIVTVSSKMHTIFKYMEVIAPSRQPILICGETGVGKELVAKALHNLSGCSGEYVAVNVAGLDDTVFADTLFGHKKGAFTGAERPRDGLVAKAASGTLFLDEIGDLSDQSQIKLLRLLQEKEYYPVGSDNPCISSARVLLATNHDLQKLIDEKRFRKDLYYRLCAHRLVIPPLRERLEDVAPLLDHFLEAAAQSFGKKAPTPPAELVTLLETYPFPGNVRELEAMVHDAVARHNSGVLSMESFSNAIGIARVAKHTPVQKSAGGNPLEELFGHFPTISEVENYLITEAMQRAKSNQGIAANLLGITRQTLNKRLQTKK